MNSTVRDPVAVLHKVREALLSRGVKTIRTIGKAFRSMDSFNGDKKIDKDEFFIGLKEFGVQLNKKESDALLVYLDTNNDGSIDFEEFLTAIRGQMNAERQAVVDAAFAKFDKDGSGIITTADLRDSYNAKLHPKVQRGEMTEDQVFLEFLQNFGDKNKDGSITKQEWNDYYNAVSCSIDLDDHFIQLMTNCWKL